MMSEEKLKNAWWKFGFQLHSRDNNEKNLPIIFLALNFSVVIENYIMRLLCFENWSILLKKVYIAFALQFFKDPLCTDQVWIKSNNTRFLTKQWSTCRRHFFASMVVLQQTLNRNITVELPSFTRRNYIPWPQTQWGSTEQRFQ